MNSHLFGPVRSRRLGISLGVDLIPPKTCTLNCAYCECGQTTHHTLERKEYISTEAIEHELGQYLLSHPELDFVTFGGSGEPTLHTGIGSLVRFVKSEFPSYKTALLTNASLFHRADVRHDCLPFDLVVPSLDAVSEDVFCKVNEPVAGLSAEMIVSGTIEFAREYRGELWMEVFVVPGVNDSPEEVANIRKAVQEISPQRVHLNTLDRPGTRRDLRPATYEQMSRVAEMFAPVPVQIISRAAIEQKKNLGSGTNLRSAVLSTVQRRPCSLEEMVQTLGGDQPTLSELITSLERDHLVVRRSVSGVEFICPTEELTHGSLSHNE